MKIFRKHAQVWLIKLCSVFDQPTHVSLQDLAVSSDSMHNTYLGLPKAENLRATSWEKSVTAYENSMGSGETAHRRSLARTYAIRPRER